MISSLLSGKTVDIHSYAKERYQRLSDRVWWYLKQAKQNTPLPRAAAELLAYTVFSSNRFCESDRFDAVAIAIDTHLVKKGARVVLSENDSEDVYAELANGSLLRECTHYTEYEPVVSVQVPKQENGKVLLLQINVKAVYIAPGLVVLFVREVDTTDSKRYRYFWLYT